MVIFFGWEGCESLGDAGGSWEREDVEELSSSSSSLSMLLYVLVLFMLLCLRQKKV